jgi:hypothetical protein
MEDFILTLGYLAASSHREKNLIKNGNYPATRGCDLPHFEGPRLAEAEWTSDIASEGWNSRSPSRSLLSLRT